jgi:hypothetical protein
MRTIEAEAYVLSAVLALGAWSCAQHKEPPKPAPPRFSITRLDGGPLTRFKREHVKPVPDGVWLTSGITEAIPGTSVRRSFVILNGPACPVKVRAFGLGSSMVDYHEPPSLLYALDWAFKAQLPVTAWEAKAYAFDQMNRYLWTDEFANGTQGKDATGLELATEYKTDRVRVWTFQLADNLGRWLTSVVFVTVARTKEGSVWFCDKEALKSQIGRSRLRSLRN